MGCVKLLRLVFSARRFADRGLFLLVQLLCGKLLKRCGQNVRVPALEKHKVVGSPLTFFSEKSMPYFFAVLSKALIFAIGDFDVGNARVLLHKLFQGLLSHAGLCFAAPKTFAALLAARLSVQLCRFH